MMTAQRVRIGGQTPTDGLYPVKSGNSTCGDAFRMGVVRSQFDEAWGK
jgi:hypothetical protein